MTWDIQNVRIIAGMFYNDMRYSECQDYSRYVL